MRSIVSYFILHPKMGAILMMLTFAFGWMSLQNINSSAMPKIDPGRIKITATYPGASPVEVEQSIVLKIENSLRGIQGIRKVTSSSSENSGTVSVKVEEKFDTDKVLIKVKNAIDGISTFPANMEKIMVSREEFSLEAVTITLTGNLSKQELLEKTRLIEDELLSLDAISKVNFVSLPEPEIEIALKEEKMRAFQLTFDEVAQKIQESNLDLTGGTIRGESELLMIRTKQKKYFASELKDIIIRNTTEGGLVYLSDLADLNDTWKEDPNMSFIDGEPAVSIKIQTAQHEDVIESSNAAKGYIEAYNAKNKNSRLILLFDKSEEVSTMLDILMTNGLQGFILVILFLSLFLNRRLSFWVALGIPISLFGMFIVAALSGITFNTVSLFGMIVVLGILVDDAVVVVESIYNHSQKGKNAIQAAIDGTMEVVPSVFSGVLTTIIAFTVFFYIEGMLGMFFMEMAVVIIGALAFSLFEGFFILPGHVAESKALKGEKTSKFEQFFTNLFQNLRDRNFIPFLHRVLNHKLLSLSVLFGLLIITLGGLNAGIIRQGDANSEDPNEFTVELEMPPGTPVDVTLQNLNKIENAIRTVAAQYDQKRKDTLPTVRYTTLNISSDNKGSLRGIIQPAELRNYESQDFVNEVRTLVGGIPEAQKLNYVQKMTWGKPVSIELISRDIKSLDAASLMLEDKLKKIDGLKNVINNKTIGSREIEITLKEKAHALGITLSAVMTKVRNGFYGAQAMRFSRGKEDIRVMVRYPQEERANISQLENMRIRISEGVEIPLHEIANFQYKRNLVQINHYNGKRNILVEADVVNSDVNLKFIKDDIDAEILPAIQKAYPDISFAQTGMDEDMEISMKSVEVVGPIFLVLLLVVILFTFRSKLQTALVFCLVPFSFIGMAWGHALHGKSIGMTSMLGLIALLGVMVNNAIILIDTYNNNLKRGENVYHAIVEATRSRFRPIILTTLTTVSGLFPLIFSGASVAKIVTPMAVTVAYGLIMATLLSLLMLPLMLLLANRLRFYYQWMIDFEKPESFEFVEPANQEIVHKKEK